MTATDTQNQIYDWIIEKFPLAKQRKIGPDDSLLEDGIVESLGTLDIVLYLEEEFGVQVSDDDMLAEHFESVRSIARLVDSKLNDGSNGKEIPTSRAE